MHITTDLIIDLPESNGFIVIAFFVDKLTKMMHLARCKKEATTMECAQLFVDNVTWLHSLPKVIISDQHACFIGKFWRTLFDWLTVDLWFSTAFHPQTNGQSEQMIQTLENVLRPYV